MTKTDPRAKDATPTTRSRRPRRPTASVEPEPATTVDDLLFEARAAFQRLQLLQWLASELDAMYGPGHPDDPPLRLSSPTGAPEKPIRAVIDDLRGELLRASSRALARYRELISVPVNVELEPVEPVFDVEPSA
jgi:hypothetical protein